MLYRFRNYDEIMIGRRISGTNVTTLHFWEEAAAPCCHVSEPFLRELEDE